MDDTGNSEVYQRWDDGFVVRRMRSDEGQQVIKWEGSKCLSYELKVLLEMRETSVDVDGFYVGELNGKMVASLVVTPVVDGLSYCGFLYVVEELRQSSCAQRISTVAQNIEQRHNFDVILCFITYPHLESMFVKFGYETTDARSTRYQGLVSTDVNIHCAGYGTDLRQVTAKKLNSLVHALCLG